MKICGVNAPLTPPVAPPLQVAIKMPVFCTKSAAIFFSSSPSYSLGDRLEKTFIVCPSNRAICAGHQGTSGFRPVPVETVAPTNYSGTSISNEGSRNDWKNLFAIKRFRYIEVLCHISYYHWGKENRSLLAVVELRRELGRVSNIN